jgi:hypothetical protein
MFQPIDVSSRWNSSSALKLKSIFIFVLIELLEMKLFLIIYLKGINFLSEVVCKVCSFIWLGMGFSSLNSVKFSAKSVG